MTDREAVKLARKMLAEGSIYTFAAYRDARRLAQLVLDRERNERQPTGI